MSKNTELRRDEISKMIIAQGEVKTHELMVMFDVSNETIRKDLNYLDKMGIATKTHGGAKVVNEYYHLPVDVKLQENLNAKKIIARKAIDYVNEGDMVYLDPGSTCIQIARFLRIKKNITVVTNSINIASIVSESDNEVIMIGGNVQKRDKSCVGYFVKEVVNSIKIDIAFFGSDGFKGFNGPTTFSLSEAGVRDLVSKRSTKKILVCDKSKFDKSSTFLFGKFKDYDYIITDETDDDKLKMVKDVRHIIKVE